MLHELLLIEDGPQIRENSISNFLTPAQGFNCERLTWEFFVPEGLCRRAFDLLIAVTPADPSNCLSLFDWLAVHPTPVATFAVLPGDSNDQLLNLAAQTVDDFLLAPVRDDELRCRLTRILGEASAPDHTDRQRLRTELGLAELVGEDPAFLSVIEKVPTVAASNAPVLLLGETGTGKELCARAIHAMSPRRSGPFIPIECGAIPEHLVENELFGHVRGAFTDAHTDQRGLVEMADGGTLLLDEVDTLTPAAQAKLLRFLQEGTYRALGSQKFMSVNLRMIAATNRDLGECVRTNRFRSDLYFRLNVLPLRLPSLRERPGDIPRLAMHFVNLICGLENKPAKSFSPSALRMLQAHSWPGNVRELFNVTQRALAFSPGPVILPSQLLLGSPLADMDLTGAYFKQARSRVILNFEQHYIEEMLRKHQGNVTRAAREAGKDRRVFGRLIKKYQIDRHKV
jgi:DNA-binding NtrC family response regulator